MDYQREYDDRCDACNKGTHYGTKPCDAHGCEQVDLCEECQHPCKDCGFVYCGAHIVTEEHTNGSITERCLDCNHKQERKAAA